MTKYATGTGVPIERTRGEIEKVLTRFGASAFGYGWEGERHVITFVYKQMQMRFVMQTPKRNERRFTETPKGAYSRTDAAAGKAWQMGCRENWRALLAVIRAKLVAIECGITTFEEEFLAKIVLPSNLTVFEQVLPLVEESYRTGIMPPALIALPAPDAEIIDV